MVWNSINEENSINFDQDDTDIIDSIDDNKEDFKAETTQSKDIYYNYSFNNNNSLFSPNPVRDRGMLHKYKYVSSRRSRYPNYSSTHFKEPIDYNLNGPLLEPKNKTNQYQNKQKKKIKKRFLKIIKEILDMIIREIKTLKILYFEKIRY